MLASLIVRFQRYGSREVDPCAAWASAIRKLREDWKTGERSDAGQLRKYLHDVPESQQAEAAQDLIAEHLRLTWQTGRGPSLETYLAEFTELASSGEAPADLVEDEFLARYQSPHGDTPSPHEYEQRFPSRSDVRELLARRCLDGGRYVKLLKRGRGAMGDVWEAYDHHLRRRVALKEPRADLADLPDALRRLAEEARVTAGLEHPGIVSVHEYHQGDGDAPFYVMRLVIGQNFNDRIRNYHQPSAERTPGERSLLWHQLLQSFVMVCDAMAHAHAGGVLHRDLKPGNIVVGEFGEAVILDWGIAKVAEVRSAECGMRNEETPSAGHSALRTPHSQFIAVAGTPDYMPPEQADGLADVRSDVFGLGAILYEILTAQSPQGWTEGARPADWLRLVRQAEFTPPRRLTPQTPRALEAVCVKALAREPDRRYQTAAELARDVRCYLAGEPVSARRATALVRAWRRVRGRG